MFLISEKQTYFNFNFNKFTRRIFYKNKFIKIYPTKIKITNKLKYSKFKNKKDIKIKDYNEDVYPLI